MAPELELVRNLSLQSYSKGHEDGLLARQPSAIAMYKSSPEFAAKVLRQASSFCTDSFTVCAQQFKNLGNLPLDFNFDFLDIRADGLGRVGGVDPGGRRCSDL
ncbi:hypothetical protein Salat_1095500 [Sesamum alatum]|uniref:Uncharacterized protein n=1 Tax=Sesamum alatum TaxID=300844 RepID=A0AAE1YNK6_9LAMI|nr:hypothetical protein Salat_1095500 [Sesamum alatum]